MTAEQAEALALDVLSWLMAEPELLQVFLGASGAQESDLRAGVHDAQFLGSVLDFLMMDDAWVMRFCDTRGVAYDRPMRARAALPGGAQVHWT